MGRKKRFLAAVRGLFYLGICAARVRFLFSLPLPPNS